MRQRLQIARNLVTRPRLVFMDEPTSGLDVSVQARLLDLIRTLVARMHLAALIVTHDLGVARLLAHRMMVMRDGRVVEDRAHRPGAGRSAASLHAAAGVLGAAGMNRDPWPFEVQTPVAAYARPDQDLHAASTGGVRLPVLTACARRARRRMRGAGRALGQRQEHAAEVPVRQLPRRRGHGRICSAAAAAVDLARASRASVLRAAPARHRLREPVPARRPARAGARRGGRALLRPKRGADARRARRRRRAHRRPARAARC